MAEYLTQLQQVIGRLPLKDVQQVVDTLLEGHEARAKIFVIGNGGSVATASHFACDLSKGTITAGVPRFRVISLVENASLMTAWAGDMSYGDVFVEQLHGLLDPGDVVIALSSTGNSECLIRAVRMARWRGAKTISFTGCGGGKLAPLTDVSVIVPSSCLEQVEDVHLALGHSICLALRQALRKRARYLGGQWKEVNHDLRLWGGGQLPLGRARDRVLSEDKSLSESDSNHDNEPLAGETDEPYTAEQEKAVPHLRYKSKKGAMEE
ncbi:MAG: SIS domain-containing protein [Anaerolineae bacterium]|nr:SIS domain-containing protein [Anaerolineae bacterium]